MILNNLIRHPKLSWSVDGVFLAGSEGIVTVNGAVRERTPTLARGSETPTTIEADAGTPRHLGRGGVTIGCVAGNHGALLQ